MWQLISSWPKPRSHPRCTAPPVYHPTLFGRKPPALCSRSIVVPQRLSVPHNVIIARSPSPRRRPSLQTPSPFPVAISSSLPSDRCLPSSSPSPSSEHRPILPFLCPMAFFFFFFLRQTEAQLDLLECTWETASSLPSPPPPPPPFHSLFFFFFFFFF